MEDSFSEQIVPGTFIRVLSEGLIAPKGVATGNVGIVGTAANAPGVSVLNSTQILSSMEDANKLYAASDAFATHNLNLMRGLDLLFRNGASTVYARGLAQGATQADFSAAVAELLKDEINLLVTPELDTTTAKTVLGAVDGAESDGRDVIAVIGCDADPDDVNAIANLKAQVTANKRFVMCAPGVFAYDAAAKQNVALPGNYSAAAVAGLIASRAVQSSPTNKVLSGVTRLDKRFSYGQIKALLGGELLVLEDRQGIRVVRGITSEGGAFRQITTRRIVDYAKAGIRQVANPFIGKLNNERVRKAMRGALDGFLTTMVVDEALIGYSLEVTATRQDEIAGRCVVNVAMQPVFSIDYIRVTLALS